MTANVDHETQVVRAFFREGRRDRTLALLRTPRGRRKFVLSLAHSRDLEPSVRVPIPPSAQSPEVIAGLLQGLGASTRCYVISEASELDGQELPLEDALRRVVGCGFGTIVSCVPGRIAYYESEEPGERFLLVRR